ncbi:hypothetical protein WMF28_17115 [Sorangium sp. So ce590]|uniref:hypothetical protein n=1 Tax=Sorangium sp. So ce590 TaxID=3133317 RepID=UPI003F64254B
MKKASLLALALLLTACEEEKRMAFGIDVQAYDPEFSASHCSLAGETETIGSLTVFDDTQQPPRPHYKFEFESDSDEQVYHVRVSDATAVDEEARWPVLAERTYDSAFGESGGQDSFVVDLNGEQVTFRVLGIPAEGGCPQSGLPDPSDAPPTSDR